MLRVSQDQRRIVGEPAFVDRVVFHFIRYRHEDVDHISDRVLRARVEHGLTVGRAYGLTWEYSLTVFVTHMIGINPEWHLQPAIHRALGDESLPPDLRIDAIFGAVTDDDWEEAAERCDADAYWQPIDASAPTGEE